jgi:hypothetical protein
MSRAVAIAGVVVVEAGGGGEVRRVGSSGGEGAKISLGGGGAIMICLSGYAFDLERNVLDERGCFALELLREAVHLLYWYCRTSGSVIGPPSMLYCYPS